MSTQVVDDQVAPVQSSEKGNIQPSGNNVVREESFANIRNAIQILKENLKNLQLQEVSEPETSTDTSDHQILDDLELKETDEYQRYHELFTMGEFQILNRYLTKNLQTRLKIAFPSIFENSGIYNFFDLENAWIYIWQNIDQKTKHRICGLEKLQLLPNSYLGDLGDEIYSIFPFSIKARFVKSFIADFQKTREEMGDLQLIQDAQKNEEKQLRDSLGYLSTTEYRRFRI